MRYLRRCLLLFTLLLTGCQSMPIISTEAKVDIPRYMGPWYVIAHIPAFLERNAYNAIESYTFEEPNVVRTRFEFNDGAFDGKKKVFNPKAFVDFDSGGGLWGMQFLWPIRAEFRIVYVSPDYQTTIIGRSKRDYVWIMARTPQISDDTYQDLLSRVLAEGYDASKIRLVPQQQVPQQQVSP
jgi:apolipoprotein D and lipocalin family protein